LARAEGLCRGRVVVEHSVLSFDRGPGATLVIRLAGAWHLREGLPRVSDVERELAAKPAPTAVGFDTKELGEWDSGVLTFLTRVLALCRQHEIEADPAGLPAGVRRLLALATAVPEKKDARGDHLHEHFVEHVGKVALGIGTSVRDVVRFIGEAAIAFGKAATGRARYRISDVLVLVQDAGAEALPIVTLISFLVGAILAFVGAVQLQQFGAAIYVANLVGIAMVREMGAMMTAIVMAGRTGASYAAQLGSMRVNQEIDSFTTMGISPLEFLVLPRMLALCLMMPLLCLYADCLGILGGAAVGVGMLELSFTTYIQQTMSAIALGDLVGGIFKASVYGVLIALAGCLRGMQSGASASAVGDATTAAVVTSIVWVISACGVFAVLFYLLGI
jgi:phospholipid/cholesterol/gamma-HCH transport system permease protein